MFIDVRDLKAGQLLKTTKGKIGTFCFFGAGKFTNIPEGCIIMFLDYERTTLETLENSGRLGRSQVLRSLLRAQAPTQNFLISNFLVLDKKVSVLLGGMPSESEPSLPEDFYEGNYKLRFVEPLVDN